MSIRNVFPRLIDNETLENDIRTQWFSEHKRGNSVYALIGEDFTNAIEAWIKKTFPEHAHEAKSLSGVIWLNRPVIAYQQESSRGLSGMMKRFLRPPSDSR